MIVNAEVEAVTSRFNEFSGHAAILREYMGAGDDRLKVVGQIQHGWSVGGNVYTDPKPLYIWNSRSAGWIRQLSAIAEEDIRLIGSPYLYLPAAPDLMDIGRVPSSLLALPQHSTSGHRFEDAYKTWHAYGCWLAQVRDEARLEQVTACLHENDYNDLGVRLALGRCGICVATCGDARMMRTTYLDRMRALALQHGAVTSNAMGTALVYAAYEGRPVFIGGPPPTMVAVKNTPEEMYPSVYDPEWLDREFPGWRCPWQAAEPRRADAERELGASYKRTRAELWDMMDLAVMP